MQQNVGSLQSMMAQQPQVEEKQVELPPSPQHEEAVQKDFESPTKEPMEQQQFG